MHPHKILLIYITCTWLHSSNPHIYIYAGQEKASFLDDGEPIYTLKVIPTPSPPPLELRIESTLQQVLDLLKQQLVTHLLLSPLSSSLPTALTTNQTVIWCLHPAIHLGIRNKRQYSTGLMMNSKVCFHTAVWATVSQCLHTSPTKQLGYHHHHNHHHNHHNHQNHQGVLS